MKRCLLILFLLFTLFFTHPHILFAKIGVGIGTGKIVLDEELKPGMIYHLPSVTVLNTGDEPGPYFVNITYHEAQPEMRPPLEWFTFTPIEFNLNPGSAQTVDINLTIPIKTIPGKYFAYIEAQPKHTSQDGNTQIGIAAASKLYFTVKSSNFIQALWYRGIALWKKFSPYPQIITAAAAIFLLFKIVGHFINFNISFKPKSKI